MTVYVLITWCDDDVGPTTELYGTLEGLKDRMMEFATYAEDVAGDGAPADPGVRENCDKIIDWDGESELLMPYFGGNDGHMKAYRDHVDHKV